MSPACLIKIENLFVRWSDLPHMCDTTSTQQLWQLWSRAKIYARFRFQLLATVLSQLWKITIKRKAKIANEQLWRKKILNLHIEKCIQIKKKKLLQQQQQIRFKFKSKSIYTRTHIYFRECCKLQWSHSDLVLNKKWFIPVTCGSTYSLCNNRFVSTKRDSKKSRDLVCVL